MNLENKNRTVFLLLMLFLLLANEGTEEQSRQRDTFIIFKIQNYVQCILDDLSHHHHHHHHQCVLTAWILLTLSQNPSLLAIPLNKSSKRHSVYSQS